MPRNQTRKLGEILRILGIVDTEKGPKVSDDVQLVYILDDVRDLLAQLARPTFVISNSSPVDAARRGIMELRPPVDSAIILSLWSNNDAGAPVAFGVFGVSNIDVNAVQILPDISLAGPSRAFLQDGNGANFGGTIPLPAGEVIADRFPTLILRPGDIFSVVSDANNTSVDMTFGWFEIPVQPATT